MIEDLRVDLDDRFWVRAYPAEKSLTAPWYVVSATGQLEGVVILARRFTPYEIGSNYILGVDHDADGVETVQLRSLGRDVPPRHEIRDWTDWPRQGPRDHALFRGVQKIGFQAQVKAPSLKSAM